MKRLLTADEMRAVDAEAVALGVPVDALMERAGAALALAAAARLGPNGKAVVLCGPGNNGGDGFVAARHLAALGRPTWVQLVGASADGLRGAPAHMWAALEGTGARRGSSAPSWRMGRGDVICDALFGTGLSRAPGSGYAEAIARIRRWRGLGATVVSADLPSGLSSDTGQPFEPHVEADVTVAFAFAKVGQAVEPGAGLCGELRVVDIGMPADAGRVLRAPATWLLEAGDARALVPPRPRQGHKGTFGHVLVVAGSAGKSGAAALSGLGALRGGAGLVTVATRPAVLDAVLAHAPELMGAPLEGAGPLGPDDWPGLARAVAGKDALVLGPGLGVGDGTGALLARWLDEGAVPTVLDADGLNALAGDPSALGRRRGAPALVLTPHPGEMARLCGLSTAAVQERRLGVARDAAARFGAVVVLKGARTVVAAPDGELIVNPTGNAGMATAGTGDVLAGLLGALLGQGLAPAQAASLGVYVHGAAGDRLRLERGQLGLIASDLLAGLGRVWAEWDEP